MAKKNKQLPAIGGAQKSTREEPLRIATMRPVWAFSHADGNGSWAWANLTPEDAQQILTQLQELGKLTWTELQQTGDHHPMEPSAICDEAQGRLTAMHLDTLESLFSFRITKKSRMWGYITAEGVYRVLWWDPEHTVYPWTGARNSRATKK